ncbi:ABC transporter ATP-binding protein [Rhodococcoides yunnanense]|uniref:ABC transporter ATP-binding protein n=1 Tax=Rhodococcoides yunnanense TaxID=278209 RepID=UPI0009339EB0|nr:ABC transporter ATP-binding protein [Rhodococcus yunnanensis]
MRLPVFFEAPATPMTGKPFQITDSMTARQLTLRTMFASTRYSVPGGSLLIVYQLCAALVPLVMGIAIDRAIAAHDAGELVLWIGVLAVDYAVMTLAFRFGSRVGFLGMNAVQHQIRTKVTDRILDPKGLGGEQRQPGMLLSIATSDARQLAAAVAIVVYPVGELFAVLFSALILLYISWPLGLAILLATPVMLWVMDRAAAPLRRRSMEQQQVAGEAAGTAADLVGGFRIVKGLGAEGRAGRRYLVASERALNGTLEANVARAGYLAAMETVSGLFIAGVAVAAGMMALSGSVTVGQLIAVVGVTQFVMGPLQAFTVSGELWAEAMASAQRVLSVLQARAVIERGASAEVPTEFGLRVTMTKDSGTRSIPDWEVEAGRFVAVDADAATTALLTEILSGRSRPEIGTATVGNVSANELNPEDRSRILLVVPHESDLFEGTIAENIAGSVDSVDAASVERAVFAAACEDVVESLPAGLQSDVGEAGRFLSGGQRQRVALARAIAADPQVLVLLDPTTAVDSVTEALVAERLVRAREGRTTVVFTSSPALLAAASSVVTLDIELENSVRMLERLR